MSRTNEEIESRTCYSEEDTKRRLAELYERRTILLKELEAEKEVTAGCSELRSPELVPVRQVITLLKSLNATDLTLSGNSREEAVIEPTNRQSSRREMKTKFPMRHLLEIASDYKRPPRGFRYAPDKDMTLKLLQEIHRLRRQLRKDKEARLSIIKTLGRKEANQQGARALSTLR